MVRAGVVHDLRLRHGQRIVNDLIYIYLSKCNDVEEIFAAENIPHRLFGRKGIKKRTLSYNTYAFSAGAENCPGKMKGKTRNVRGKRLRPLTTLLIFLGIVSCGYFNFPPVRSKRMKFCYYHFTNLFFNNIISCFYIVYFIVLTSALINCQAS